jgi:hypothetical protein
MKKLYFSILTMLILSTSSIWAVVFLQNNYNAPIEYIELGDNADEYLTLKPSHLKKLDKGAETILTDKYFENALSLRTVGGKFQNVSSDLRTLLQQSIQEKNQHPYDEPVIVISNSYNPYYRYYAWHLSLSWKPRR